MTISSTTRNVLVALDDRAPLLVLQEILDTLDAPDRKLLQTALHLGIVTDPLIASPGPGDFLIRNVTGVDQSRGILAIGEKIREGQVVQFHVRDRGCAADDLRRVLDQHVQDGQPGPAGALLFSCMGRGRNLFGRPDHDTGLFRDAFGPVPLGGFFCNGEIGPVASSTYLHGFTSAFGLFGPA